jgi:hypothetical protein
MKKLILALTFPLALFSCDPVSDKSELAIVTSSWIEGRVSRAEEKLSSNEAGQKVWQAIEAHGGLQN